jgi:hypothetical protein
VRVDSRLRVLYLVAVAVGAFFVHDARIAGALVGAHALAWLALGLGARALLRQIVKLWGFTLFILVSYGITSESDDIDRWIHVWKIPINVGGIAIGGLMILRVIAVVLASRLARAGDERAIALGLRRLGVPGIVAHSIDAVLALIGGRGKGDGSGGGRNRKSEAPPGQGGFWQSLKKIARGDVAPIVDRMERQIARADTYLYEEHGEGGVSRDGAIIVGLSLTMLGIKALKVLPSIPFAPGHKLVLLTPLYVVASLKTKMRAGATLTGLVMGTAAFLLGDGRYGIFEILKHIAPGIICDLCVPFLVRKKSGAPSGAVGASPPDVERKPGAFAWSLLGGIMGVGRFATIFTVTLAVQPPKVAWAFLIPGLVVHTTFGVLSGLVSSPLIRAVIQRDAQNDEASSR